VKALYFGTYDRDHPRNVNAIAAMRMAGVDVVERQAPVRGHGLSGALSVFGAETRLLAPKRGDFDVVIVGYPGHFDVPRARRIAHKKPLVFDAVLSLEDELIAVRRRYRDRSAAATVLRAIDYRALRLPNLVVCGTDAEARYLEELGAKKTASVFLGADEDAFCETWAPAYPFSAVHFGDDPVVAETEASVPIDVLQPDDRPLAVAHSGIVLGTFGDSRVIPAIVFEALATGAPVVTADTEAARELLADGDSALLVPPESPGALGEAIDRLAADEALRTRIAARGQQIFRERASREVLGARWYELLQQTLQD
jgi:glycosyltransferase involved in cell wall biosynthesis